GFRDVTAGSTIAAAGSLSGIIPPSIILILYGVVTETPIGSLFIAAIVPGIMMTIVIIGVMLYFHKTDKRKPLPEVDEEIEAGEIQPLTPLRAGFVVLVGAVIVTVIFGGIYSGVFTPTEA